MVDFSALGQGDVGGFLFGGNDPSGLLTPAQQKGVNSDAMLGLAAGLLQAGGPSPYKAKMRIGSDIGSGLAAGLQARQQSQKDAITQSYVRTQMLDKGLPIIQQMQPYLLTGQKPPAYLQQLYDQFQRMAGGGLPPPMPGQAGVPGVPSVGPQVPQPGAASPPAATTSNPYMQSEGARMAAKLGYPPEMLLMQGPLGDEARKNVELRLTEESEARKTQAKGQIEHSQKLYGALQDAGRISQASDEFNREALALYQHPNFYSGPFADVVKGFRQVQAVLGKDKDAAFPQEAFAKITAEQVGSGLNEAKAALSDLPAGAGRFLLPQVNLAIKAAANESNTALTNQFLSQQALKISEQIQGMAKLARDYAKTHGGHLDQGFDEELADWTAKHPALTTGELRNLTAVAAGKQMDPQTGAILGLKNTFDPRNVGAASAAAAPPPPGAMHRAVGLGGEVIYLDAQGKPITTAPAPTAPAGPAMRGAFP
jgi:hypothetical protein